MKKEEVSGKKEEASAKKEEPWVRTRHRVVRFLFWWIVWLLCWFKYGIRPERFRGTDGPYLILFNHETPLDQFFVALSFRDPVYFLATEDIFSTGWVAKLLKWAVAPIPIKKTTTDLNALRTMVKVSKEGGTIAIAPEGNRTYSGKTEHMLPTISHFAKLLNMPVILYRIEGGYGVEPRWSTAVRRGPMRAYVSELIPAEEVKELSKEALFERIERGLYVNEANSDASYRSRKKAEYLERAAYVCPFCGFSVFESHGDETECLSCHRKIRYREDKRLEGVGFDFPFEYFNDWYEYQKDFVNRLDVTRLTDDALFTDRARVSEVIVYERKERLFDNAEIRLYGDRMEVLSEGAEPWVLPFREVSSAAVLGRNKLNVYHDGKVFQFKGDRRFNAIKYVNLFFRYKNIQKGDENGEFLGL
ncbi:MAG: 1-acyl-sn-glycerol-3-phosphate acyltransferase [Lachnospiraceae bacterium]|nr:1-acyl-sn-glycerol-3-phosphate acyltransferase [Lachnospiraceae bacterium]